MLNNFAVISQQPIGYKAELALAASNGIGTLSLSGTNVWDTIPMDSAQVAEFVEVTLAGVFTVSSTANFYVKAETTLIKLGNVGDSLVFFRVKVTPIATPLVPYYLNVAIEAIYATKIITNILLMANPILLNTGDTLEYQWLLDSTSTATDVRLAATGTSGTGSDVISPLIYSDWAIESIIL